MARAPVAADLPPDDAMSAGAAPPMAGEGEPAESASTVLVTICKSADGTYMVYAGDEPEEGAEPAEPAEGAEPGEPALEAEGQGQPAESIGAALKAALDILQSDESENGGGNKALEDGFSGQGGIAAPANPPGA